MAIAVTAAFGLFTLDRLALTPYTQQRDRLNTEQLAANQRLADGRRAIQKQRAAKKDWDELQAQGLESDASEMERRVQHWLHLWAQEAGLGNLSLRADRSAAKHAGFTQVTVHTTGSGPMGAVAKLLWRLEAAPVPLRVNDVQLNPGREGSDQVQLQLKVSALCTAPESEPAGGGGGRLRPAAGRQTVTGERL